MADKDPTSRGSCLIDEGARPKKGQATGHVTGVEAGAQPALDPRQILASVGEVPYEWRIDSDALVWGANVGAVLAGADAAALASGRGYSQLVDPGRGTSRYDAVMRAAKADDGAGVPYQVQYALRAGGKQRIWIEDTGRWFAGRWQAGACAHGVVRRSMTARARRRLAISPASTRSPASSTAGG